MSDCLADTIIYDDDEIRVIWSPGDSDFVTITFGDLITFANGDSFFADVPLKKSGIASIGIMAKSGNWYPQIHLQNASEFILEKIKRYETRVLYGGSMGGYAAVKFSRLLGGTHVIALCPQWSIDPAECEGVDPGWGHYFLPMMRGMGIRPRDVSGEVFLFADAFDTRDMFHCHKIMKSHSNSYFVSVPAVGHHVTTVFAGTGNLLRLINASRIGDITALRQLSRRARKRHIIWSRSILGYAMRKLPTHGISFLADDDQRELLRENWRYFPHILRHLTTTVNAERAVSFFESCWALLPGLAERQLICAYLASITGRRVGIGTAHRSWLIYNLSENKVLHRDAMLDPWEAPVEIRLLDIGAELIVRIGPTEFYLSINESGRLHVAPAGRRRADRFLFEINSGENEHFTISVNGHYMSAEPGRKEIVCDRNQAQGWEMFRLGSM